MDTSRRQRIANKVAEILETYDVVDAVIGGVSWDIATALQDELESHKMTQAQRREFERGKHAASEDIATDSVSYDIDLSSWYGKGYADMLDSHETDF